MYYPVLIIILALGGLILSGTVVKALRDYEKQKKQGKTPVFYAAKIGMNEDELHYWNSPAEKVQKKAQRCKNFVTYSSYLLAIIAF